jgi:hypothetical protein
VLDVKLYYKDAIIKILINEAKAYKFMEQNKISGN